MECEVYLCICKGRAKSNAGRQHGGWLSEVTKLSEFPEPRPFPWWSQGVTAPEFEALECSCIHPSTSDGAKRLLPVPNRPSGVQKASLYVRAHLVPNSMAEFEARGWLGWGTSRNPCGRY